MDTLGDAPAAALPRKAECAFSLRSSGHRWDGAGQEVSCKAFRRELGEGEGQAGRRPHPASSCTRGHVCLVSSSPRPGMASRLQRLRCAQEGSERLLSLGVLLPAPAASVEGGGSERAAAGAPNVQGTRVSPGTSVTAITHFGWWFCLHNPKQRV